jgi:APA family basic amino acid/polyamine antiporter
LPYWNGRYIMPFLYAGFLYMFGPRIRDAFQNLSHDNLPEALFLVFTLLVTLLSLATVVRKYSLIPVLGVLFCAYLLVEIPAIAWEWFFVWMAIGLTIYFFYGYRKSKLRPKP